MELLYGMDDGLGESLYISEDGIVVGLCYRLPEQGDEVAEAFFKQPRKSLDQRPCILWGISTS